MACGFFAPLRLRAVAMSSLTAGPPSASVLTSRQRVVVNVALGLLSRFHAACTRSLSDHLGTLILLYQEGVEERIALFAGVSMEAVATSSTIVGMVERGMGLGRADGTVAAATPTTAMGGRLRLMSAEDHSSAYRDCPAQSPQQRLSWTSACVTEVSMPQLRADVARLRRGTAELVGANEVASKQLATIRHGIGIER